MLLALDIWPLATHPFRDGAPFRLLIETTFGRSSRFLQILHRKCLLILSPCCFAFCGHQSLGYRSFSRYYLVSQTSPCQIRSFSSSLTHPVPSCILHILPLCELYSLLPSTRAHLCISPLDYWYTSCFWQVQVSYTKSLFQRFRVVYWTVQIRFHLYIILTPVYL